MKFLIFNIMVLGCLGYLLMAKPNENFLQWASNTKEKVSKLSKDEFLKKINNAVKSKEKNNLKATKDKLNDLKGNDILKMVKMELSKYDKKLENTLKSFSTKEQNKVNKVKNKKVDYNNNQLLNNSNKNLKNKNTQFNQFMSKTDRSNALAELITDMELYGLEN